VYGSTTTARNAFFSGAKPGAAPNKIELEKK
jgi:hypothetical protein